MTATINSDFNKIKNSSINNLLFELFPTYGKLIQCRKEWHPVMFVFRSIILHYARNHTAHQSCYFNITVLPKLCIIASAPG